jgi:hypothetical protein
MQRQVIGADSDDQRAALTIGRRVGQWKRSIADASIQNRW